MQTRSVPALLVIAAWAGAQEVPEIAPDRPGFADGILTVPRGIWQMEVGANWESELECRRWLFPGYLVRAGVNRRFELRLGYDSLIRERNVLGLQTGWSDVQGGAKVTLRDPGGRGPGVAATFMLSLPAGRRNFSSGSVDPAWKLSWSQSIPGELELGGCYLWSALSDGGVRYTQQGGSLSIGRELLAGIGGFAEVFLLAPGERQGARAVYYGAGFWRLLGRSAQVDVSFGHHARFGRPDWYVSTGFSLRSVVLR